MIHPSIDKLLEQRGLALRPGHRRGQSARGRSTTTTTSSAKARSTSSAAARRVRSKNYLTMALEEISEGKIEYAYKS